MPDRPATSPVTPAAHRTLLAAIARELPAGMRLMVIGGGLMIQEGAHSAATTKDEDLVLLVADGASLKVADVQVTEGLIRRLGAAPRTRKDQTSVQCRLTTNEGEFLVEFVRGRRGGHGYFVARAVLEAVALVSSREGGVLTPPLEALAFLKAWAAVDKAKLVRSGRDGRGYHAGRERAFRDDVSRIRVHLLERRTPDLAIFRALFSSCSAQRVVAVRAVLTEEGWLL